MSPSETAPAQSFLADDWAPSGEIKGEYLSDIIRLPGYWEGDVECEALKPIGFCEAGHVQLGSERSCRSRTCPYHWGRWRKQAAVNIVARLAAYRATQEGIDRRLLHVSASGPQDKRWTTEKFWKQRSEAYDALEAVGGRGGVKIPHPYAVSDKGEAMWTAVTEEGDVDLETGKWRFLRDWADGTEEEWDNLRELIEVRPHQHTLMVASEFDPVEIPEEWVVKNIRALAPFYPVKEEVPRYQLVDEHGRIPEPKRTREDVVQEGYESMARLSMYLLSHAGVQPETGDLPQRQTVTYWGKVHPNSFDPEEELSAEMWEKIQKRAEEAVGVEIEEETEAEAGDLCEIGDCEAEAHGLTDLDEFVSDPAWIESLDYELALEILGLKAWGSAGLSPGGSSMGDRPPPGGFARSPEPSGDLDRSTREDWVHFLRRLGRRELKKNVWVNESVWEHGPEPAGGTV